jgi:hypothetical protein
VTLALEIEPDESGVYWITPRSQCYKFCEICDGRITGYPGTLKSRKYCTRICGGVGRSRIGATDKTCSSCKVTKPLSAFSKNASSKGDGCYSVCRVCVYERNTSRLVELAPLGHRTCKVCNEIKPLSEFLTATDARLRPVTCELCARPQMLAKHAAYYAANAERECAKNRARYAANPMPVLVRSRAHRLGITEKEYNRILLAQNGVCSLCGLPERAMRNGELLSLAVDHCHETDVIRGLLCLSCNTMLGKVEALGVEKIYDYLN